MKSFDFAWRSPYGHIVRLVEELALSPGLVLDIGCGTAPLAEQLAERGYQYLGLEIDEEAIALMIERGIDARWLDLRKHETLAAEIVELVAGRPVAAILMLDVLEHIPAPNDFLAALRTTTTQLGRPPLLMSVPNATHIDVVAKLTAARWDMRPSGLLDQTHVGFFGEARLTEMLAGHGWRQMAENDFSLDPSDQHFPADLAHIEAQTNLGAFLRAVREAADDHAIVNQFVRAYVLLETTPRAPEADTSPAPFLSVAMRTTGDREIALLDALTCLAAQTDPDFEVLLAVHHHDPARAELCRQLVSTFHPSFAFRVRVLEVVGGGRSRPLNAALDEARGRYLAFLDDDDLVTGDWVEQFRVGAERRPGRIVRSASADQSHALRSGPLMPYEPTGPVAVTRPLRFDALAHYHHNETPICSFALPMQTLRSLRLRFDESLAVVEDWDLLMRTSTWTGVVDTEVVTSLYRRWDAVEGSLAQHDAQVWDVAREAVLDRLDAGPVLLPAGTVRRLASNAAHYRIEDATDPRVAALEAQLAAFENSQWWRLTAPMRRVGTVARRIARRVLRRT